MISMLKTNRLLALFLPWTLCLGACVSSVTSQGLQVPSASMSDVPDHPYQGDWLRPNADLARRLRDQGARLPYLHSPQ